MKKIFFTILMVSAVTSVVSCRQDFEEINKSPNNPDKALSYGLFNSANKELIDATRGSFTSARMALPWMQYSAQRNYTEEDRFQYRLSVGDDIWRDLYLVAQDYKTIIELNTDAATKNQMGQYGSNANQIAASRIMLAYVFSGLVDRFGDVPYYSYGSKDEDFQALQDNITPKFASQEKIYADILKELKEASEMIELSETSVFTKGDALFGTPLKMKKFANSLRLRIANRVKDVVPSAASHITDAISSGVMTSNADTVGLTYEKNATQPAPFWASFFVDNRVDFGPTNTFIETLKGERGIFGVDPRLQKYFAPYRKKNPEDPTKYITVKITEVRDASYQESDNLDDYQGMPYGIETKMAPSQRGVASFFSSNVLKQDFTEVLMEYSEVCFILSEVNNWDDAWYRKGVEASMNKWGVSSGKISNFVNALPVANKANVLNQKYIALYLQPQEAWNEYRRTGYPNTLLKVGEKYKLNTPYKEKKADGSEVTFSDYTFNSLIVDLDDIPSRLFYPTQAQTLNSKNYKDAVEQMGGDKMNTKLIWDKN